MSLDGYVTAADAGPGQGLGRNGLPLHDWAIGETSEVDRGVLQRATRRTGAVVMGRRTFDVVDAPTGWNEEIAYGAGEHPSQLPPVFVVTHDEPNAVRLQHVLTFVTTGVRDAIDRAQAAGRRAGRRRDGRGPSRRAGGPRGPRRRARHPLVPDPPRRRHAAMGARRGDPSMEPAGCRRVAAGDPHHLRSTLGVALRARLALGPHIRNAPQRLPLRPITGQSRPGRRSRFQAEAAALPTRWAALSWTRTATQRDGT
jgi:dihydrofolate reductase